jgi:hypothetical protein
MIETGAATQRLCFTVIVQGSLSPFFKYTIQLSFLIQPRSTISHQLNG